MGRTSVVVRVAAAVGLLLAVVMLGEVAAAPSAQALTWAPPKPPALPSSITGEGLVSTGVADASTAAGAGVGLVDVGGLVAAGYGAYSGTCWALNQLQKLWDGDGSCVTASDAYQWAFGSNGEKNGQPSGTTYCNYSTGTAVCNTNAGNYDPSGTEFLDWTAIDADTAKVGYTALVTCKVNATGAIRQFWSQTGAYSSLPRTQLYANIGCWTPAGMSEASSSTRPAGTYGGFPWAGSGNYDPVCSSNRATCSMVGVVIYKSGFGNGSPTYGWVGTTGTILAWYPPGSAPWTVQYTETCMNSAGTTATASTTKTFTPASNYTDTSALPACETVLPGSKPQKVDVLGGRSGITVPNPEVHGTLTLFSPSAQSSYPICTTGVGCYLDLKKNGQSCNTKPVGVVYCAGWQQNTVDTFTCWYGPYKLATTACVPDYGTAFDGEPQPDPNQQPSPGPSSSPSAGTSTGPSTGPSASAGPGTGLDPGPQSNTAPDPTGNPSNDTRACDGAFGGFSIKAWVEDPVECALEKMFAPGDPPSFQDLPSPLPAGWFPSIPTLSDSNCGTVTLPAITLGAGPLKRLYGPYTLFDTCKQPWPQVRAVTYYGVLTLITISAVFRGLYMVMNGLGLAVQADAAFTDFAIRDLGSENDVI